MLKRTESFNYKGINNTPSKCQISIYKNNNQTTVVATEIPDNPGTKLIDSWGVLPYQICQYYNLNQRATDWVAYYPANKTNKWFLLKPTGVISWKCLTKNEVKAITET